LNITAESVRQLREETGAGVMDCKRALTEAAGDFDKAKEVLRQRGLAAAEKKAGRVAAQGLIESYIHAGGRIGVLLELNCESDFVARTDDFRALAHDLAMQVAALAPTYIRAEDVPAETQVEPNEILLNQPFIRDAGVTIQDLIRNNIARLGENIQVRRFVRFSLGEGAGQ
jgi:elongation factor Ts